MSRRLKILHVVFSLEPGGTENGLVNVARRLDAAAFDVHVACLERRGSFAERLPDPAQVTVLEKPPGFSARTVRRLAQLFRRLRPDVIHTHNFGPLLYSALAGGGFRFPILHGEHGMIAPGDDRRAMVWLRQLCYSRARRVHTVSSGLRDHFIANGFPPHKIEAVLNGVDAARFQPGAREEARRALGLPPDAQIIGMVGRMLRLKRHRELIEAFEPLARENPRLHLLVVGDSGGEEARVRAQAQASPLAQRIHLAGHQEDVRAYYHAFDLLVIPSLNEGFANVVLEAMASGIPVLGHPTAGITEAIRSGEDGFLHNLAETTEMRRRIQELLADPVKLEETGRRARHRAVEQFSLDRMADNYARLYRRVAANPP